MVCGLSTGLCVSECMLAVGVFCRAIGKFAGTLFFSNAVFRFMMCLTMCGHAEFPWARGARSPGSRWAVRVLGDAKIELDTPPCVRAGEYCTNTSASQADLSQAH